mgnify:CR=1 FL=1
MTDLMRSTTRVPKDGSRGPTGGSRLSLRRFAQRRRRLFLDGDDGDPVPELARRVQRQEREGAVAGDEADSHAQSSAGSSARRLGRRSSTPRWELRMKSTTYCTSAQASVPSCSIRLTAWLVLSFDTRRYR